MLKKYIENLLQNNPLNGISTYKDVLTLSTGVISRNVKKLVLTGDTSISNYAGGATGIGFVIQGTGMYGNRTYGVCSHFRTQSTGVGSAIDGVTYGINNTTIYFTFSAASVAAHNLTDITSIKQFLADQYAADTPVTVWYALATPTAEQITVPTGLSGTVDGHTTQTGTPTSTSPIYPTSNPVTTWAKYTPNIYNNAWTMASGQPEQYNGGWT